MFIDELADELEKSTEQAYTPEYLVRKAANMLRQQQIEIERLKQYGYKAEYEKLRKEQLNERF